MENDVFIIPDKFTIPDGRFYGVYRDSDGNLRKIFCGSPQASSEIRPFEMKIENRNKAIDQFIINTIIF